MSYVHAPYLFLQHQRTDESERSSKQIGGRAEFGLGELFDGPVPTGWKWTRQAALQVSLPTKTHFNAAPLINV